MGPIVPIRGGHFVLSETPDSSLDPIGGPAGRAGNNPPEEFIEAGFSIPWNEIDSVGNVHTILDRLNLAEGT
jgi:hypothetical protein